MWKWPNIQLVLVVLDGKSIEIGRIDVDFGDCLIFSHFFNWNGFEIGEIGIEMDKYPINFSDFGWEINGIWSNWCGNWWMSHFWSFLELK